MVNKVFVGHLSPDVRNDDLERFFKDHGFSKSIQEVVVKVGYGFVVFDDRRDADDAIYELNGKDLMGSRIQVEHAKPSGRSSVGRGRGDFGYRRDDRDGRGYGGSRRPPSSRFGSPYNTDYKVLIDNVSSRCSWQDIKDYFRQAGEVTFAKCHKERMGQGVVEFATCGDMKNAVRMLDDTELFGKRIKLTTAYRGSRSRSRSRSPRMSRSKRRSYSRSRSRSPR